MPPTPPEWTGSQKPVKLRFTVVGALWNLRLLDTDAQPVNTESPTESADAIRITPTERVDADALRTLYDSVGWSAYTRDIDALLAAIDGSDHVVIAQIDDALIGLARAISDDVSIVYIQDILVCPSQQGRGVGRRLVSAVLSRYKHVRQKVLLTDGRPQQLKFYASLGFKNTRDLVQTPLNAFVIIEGAELS